MAYANAQKNGSLHERLQLEIPLSSVGAPNEEIVQHEATNIEKPYNDLGEQ